jgi:3',5'-cyclic-AMP phosphodiesterase
MKAFNIICAIVSMLFFSACSDWIEYSPYDVDIQGKNLNEENTGQIASDLLKEGDTLKFAVISDSHKWYDELHDAVNSINNQNDIKFVVCLGDITNWGNTQEFKWYYDQVKRLKYPLITVIGNHDYLGNGQKIYARMFGETNYTFNVNSYKFIVFDDIVWEHNNQEPDFNWLDQQMKGEAHNILLSHIPVWSNQLEGSYCQKYDSVLQNNSLILALHGHDHINKDTVRNGIHHELIGSMFLRKYAIVSLYVNSYNIKRINF